MERRWPECGPFIKWKGRNMRYVRLGLLATASLGLIAILAPASAQVVATPDGHYYRLVPAKRPVSGTAAEIVNVIPEQATASVPPVSNCRLTTFYNGEYQPQYITLCGPP
jgi:hypothetical protein